MTKLTDREAAIQNRYLKRKKKRAKIAKHVATETFFKFGGISQAEQAKQNFGFMGSFDHYRRRIPRGYPGETV